MSKKLKILIAVAVLVTLIFQVVSVVFVVNLISGGNKDHVFYLKNRQLYCSDFSDALYHNKKKIDSNVYNMQYIKETGEFVYITDWDYENNWGTLKIHDGKAKKIAENVCFFDLSFDGDVVFITDYKANFREGVLYAYNGKKTFKIDEEVNCILPIYREDD